MMIRHILLSLFVMFCGINIALSNSFPLREKYPDVTPIDAEVLRQDMKGHIVVDVRSRYEFDIIHIKRARHVSLSKKHFLAVIKRLRNRNPEVPIVFYCNGTTCAKSYKAARKAMRAGIDNVMAMDWGIFNWAKTYPDQTKLLGKSPIDPARLISKSQLKAHMLTPKAFVDKVNSETVVIDIRDAFQRNIKILNDVTQPIPLGKVNSYVKKMAKKGKTLLIYDAVGKQVRWLQYYLEKNEIKDYYFMEGGVRKFVKEGL